MGELADHVDSLLGSEAREHTESIAAKMIEMDAPPKLAQLVARLFALDGAFGLAKLSVDTGIKPTELANAFIDLGARLGLDWAQAKATVLEPEDPWERVLVAGLARDFQQMRLDFLREQARRGKDKDDPLAAIESWAARHPKPIAQFRSIVGRAQAATPVQPAMLAQIASQARGLLLR